MIFEIRFPDSVPPSEFSCEFVQGMADRMATSHFKYGMAREASKRIDFTDEIRVRLKKYEDTGNTEWLMDAANNAMLEFMFPKHPEAHFRSTGSDESPGRRWIGETNRSPRHIREP